MTKTYRRLIAASSCLVIISLVLPILVEGAPIGDKLKNANATSAADSVAAKAAKAFCSRLDEISTRVNAKIIERQTKLGQKQQAIASRVESDREKVNQKLSDVRDRAVDNINQQFAKLEEKAQTDAQKQAVVQFKTAVQAAIVARQAKINKASADFRKGIDEIKQAREQATTEATKAYEQQISAVYEKSQRDCAAGVDAKIIKKNVKQGLKSAQDSFQAARNKAEKRTDTMKTLNETKKAAFKLALQEFNTAMDKAKKNLKAVFPAPTPNSTSTPTSNIP